MSEDPPKCSDCSGTNGSEPWDALVKIVVPWFDGLEFDPQCARHAAATLLVLEGERSRQAERELIAEMDV